MNKKFIFLVASAVVALSLVFVSPAYANMITVAGSATMNNAPGLTALGSVTYDTTAKTFIGSLKFSNSTSVEAFVVAWSLQLFTGSSAITSFSASGAGWTDFYAEKQSNNGTACKSSSNTSWLCGDGFTSGAIPFTPGLIAGLGSATFNFSGHYSTDVPVAVLDLMADGCTTTSYTVDGTPSVNCSKVNGKATKWEKSANLNGPVPPTPEPASLLLLGSGLAGLALKLRRHK